MKKKIKLKIDLKTFGIIRAMSVSELIELIEFSSIVGAECGTDCTVPISNCVAACYPVTNCVFDPTNGPCQSN